MTLMEKHCSLYWPQPGLVWTRTYLLMAALVPSLMLLPPPASALCPMRCSCQEDKLIVNCEEAYLDVVPITLNPELRELYLSHNQIKSIRASFSFYQRLELLDVSSNALTSIGKKNFAMQTSLRVLFAGRNKISEINNQSFHGLSFLQFLNLSDNRLEQVPSRVFAGVNRLERLDLSGNRIQGLAPEAFSGLINLKTLLLRGNQLTNVPTPALYHLPNLLHLDLGFNAFPGIAEFAFAPLTALQELKLDGSHILAVSPMSFSNLNNSLSALHLEGNLLEGIPSQALEHLNHLEHLIIGNNRIARLEAFALRGLANLKSLVIQGDHQLADIDPDAFSGNPRLVKLVLEFCPNLRRLGEGTFRAQKRSLRSVSFRGNQLSSIPSDLLEWEHLQYLDFRRNPVNCTCSLRWLWQLLRRSNFTGEEYSQDLVCSEPHHLRGHPFLSLTLPQMACFESKSPEIITATLIGATLSVVSGLLLALCYYRTRLAGLFIFSHKKYEADLREAYDIPTKYLDPSKEGHLLDQRVLFPPATSIVIQPPFKMHSISQL